MVTMSGWGKKERLNLGRSAVVGSRAGKFRMDGRARPWLVGPRIMLYMLSHEATIAGRCICSRISSDSRWRLG